MRQADTLYSGILLRGSSVRWVSRFALRPPRPVVGNEDRVGTDRAHHHRLQGDRGAARRDRHPIAGADPCCSARRGWISSFGSGY